MSSLHWELLHRSTKFFSGLLSLWLSAYPHSSWMWDKSLGPPEHGCRKGCNTMPSALHQQRAATPHDKNGGEAKLALKSQTKVGQGHCQPGISSWQKWLRKVLSHYYPSIIKSIPFHSQKCLDLDNKLWSHSVNRWSHSLSLNNLGDRCHFLVGSPCHV